MDSLTTGVGTGIGLALTKGIIELHHGTIKVESELGKGSSFIIRLDVYKRQLNLYRQQEDFRRFQVTFCKRLE